MWDNSVVGGRVSLRTGKGFVHAKKLKKSIGGFTLGPVRSASCDRVTNTTLTFIFWTRLSRVVKTVSGFGYGTI